MLNDLRIAIRSLIRRPGFAAAATITLGLGIGANTAVFSVLQGVLLRPLPYPDADRLVIVRTVRPDAAFANTVFAAARVDAWRTESRTFARMAHYAGVTMTVTGDGDAAQLRVTRVVAAFFDVFALPPALGGYFDDAPGSVVVLSHALWQSRYASRPDIVGTTIRLDGTAFEVAGVAAPSLTFPANADAWIPLVLSGSESGPNTAFLNVIGRLAPGVRPDDVNAELERIAGIVPRAPTTPRVSTVTLLEQEVGSSRARLLTVGGAVAFVLLIACVNVANLLLARAITRRGEMAIRSALGAGRGRLLRQLVTESLLLSVLGGWLGLLLAVWMVRVLVTLAPAEIRRIDQVSIDPVVLGFAALLSTVTGVAAGLLPGLQAMRMDVADGLRGVRKGLTGGASHRPQSVLVSLEVTLTVVLLVCGLLLAASFLELTRVNTGLQTEGVVAFDVSLPRGRYPGAAEQRKFVEAALSALRDMPGVQSAGFALAPPFSGWNFAQAIHGRDSSRGTIAPLIQSVSGGYFESLGIRLESGRYLTDRDTSTSPRVAVISRALARALWPSDDAVGRHIGLAPANRPGAGEAEVVGVVADVLHGSLTASPVETLYLPVQQRPSALLTALIKSSQPDLAAAIVRERMRTVDTDLPLQNVNTMDRRVARTTDQAKYYTLVLGTFAFAAVALAIVGVSGLVAYFVGQRTHDIGIHIALGATAKHIATLVISTGLIPVAIGLAGGLGLSLLATRTMREFLFNVSPLDPTFFAAAAAVVLTAALAACYLPARRAARVDPSTALRAE
jgi:predicted permease